MTEIVPYYPMDIDADTGEIIDLMTHTSNCGAAIFHNDLDTIEFVLNKRLNCDLHIKMVSALKIQMKFDLSIDDFYTNNAKETLTQNISSFLGIPPNRIRIVSIRAGSVIVD